MSVSWQPIVAVHAAAWSGDAEAPPLARFGVQRVALTWSWGVEPGEALVTFVVADGEEIVVAPYQEVVLELFGRRFYGVATTGSRITSSGGNEREFRYVDHRLWLDADMVFGYWNRADSRLVQGRWVRRWAHLRPADFASNRVTWTTRPLTAEEVLNDIFGAPGLAHAFVRQYHPALQSTPTQHIDASGGRKVADLVAAVSQVAGLAVTAEGYYRLRWGRLGALDPIIPANADDIDEGDSVSRAATRVHVVGGRNLYQVTNLVLEPDWNPAWQRYWLPDGDLTTLVALVYHRAKPAGSSFTYASQPIPSGDSDAWAHWNAAEVRARRITVAELATLVPEPDLRDARLFAGRPRNSLPAAVYLRELVYRAFRLPQTIRGRHRAGLRIVRDGPSEITFDPVTGVMSAAPDTPGHGAGEGMVICQNSAFDTDLLVRMPPEALDMVRFRPGLELWAPVAWSVDQNGEEDGQVLILESPAARLADAIAMSDGLPTFRADLGADGLPVCEVRASLALEGERYILALGQGRHSTAVQDDGVRREIVLDARGGIAQEVPYADGRTAEQVARLLAAPQLNLPFVTRHGGFTLKLQDGENMGPLSEAYARVTAQWGPDGHTVRHEFATHRDRATYVPEPELDRRYQMEGAIPGVGQLREEARRIDALTRALRGDAQLRSQLRAAYGEMVGERGPVESTWFQGGETLPVGTPAWRAPLPAGGGGARTAVAPGSVGDAHTEFLGTTVREGETGGVPVPTQRSGTLLARVDGPVEAMGGVGRANGRNALVATEANAIGIALQAVPAGQTRLIRVRAPAGGGGVGGAAYYA